MQKVQMRSWRENPDGSENTKATKQIEREIGALKLQAQSEEIACPNCYGGHFRPANGAATLAASRTSQTAWPSLLTKS